MAEVIARSSAGRRGWSHVEIRSAGASAVAGSAASGGALRAAERHGLDLSDHSSVPVSQSLVEWADLALVMAPHHLVALAELGGAAKSALLTAFVDSDDSPESWQAVADPFGSDDSAYEATFRELQFLVERALERLEPILDP